MDSLASTLIKQNLESKNPYLDLGQCGLTGSEPELELLVKCTHLKVLVMANQWYDYESSNVWTRISSRNQGMSNKISVLGDYFPKRLKALVLSNNQIKDISSLTNLLELKILILDYNQISDVSPLSRLDQLERLCLIHNQLSDISSLERIQGIKELYLGYNQIQDISILSSLYQLRILYLRYNKISNLPTFVGLKSLRYLHLGYNPISEIGPLSDLTQLEILSFENNQLSDLTPVAKLLQLKVLVLNRNKLVDASAISNLQQLVSLDLMVNQLSDLKTVSTFRQLRYLNISGNELSDLRPLNNLIHLQNLRLWSNNITVLSTLSNLTNLKELNVEFNTVEDLSPIAKLIRLEKLMLRKNSVTDLMPLRRLVNLKELDLSYNQIENISALVNFSQLETLNLSNNKIHNFSFLNNLHALKEVDISSNNTSDLSSLCNLGNLEKIKASKNEIVDLALFGGMPIKELDLSENKIKDLSKLCNLHQLEKLFLSGNKLTDFLKSFPSFMNLVELDLSKNSIRDVSAPFILRKLEKLNLSENLIKDVKPLGNLPDLIELNLSKNLICDVSGLEMINKLENLNLHENQISDVRPLGKLMKIKDLNLSNNKVSDVSKIPIFNFLEILNLASNNIFDISSMGSYPSLRELIVYQNHIKDISSIPAFLNLEKLNLSYNKIGFIFKDEFDKFPNLRQLSIRRNPVQNIPKEIVDSNVDGLSNLKAFFIDIESGAEQNNEVKIILIGNGNVGKTELSRRLTEGDSYIFEENHNSTPGISLSQAKLISTLYQSDLVLNIWDFGGQDLYHATHRLFMQTRAIIILVWDAANEFNDFHLWNGKQYKNHKLLYWLSYADIFAPDSPLIVFENKVDENYGDGHLPNPEKVNLRKSFPNIAGFMFGSAKTGLKIGAFKNFLLKTLENNSIIKNEIFNIPLPKSWINVRDQIREIQLDNPGLKEISRENFYNLCVSENIGASTEPLLSYLHETGVLYFREHYFDKKIILDQAWMIKAVYQIFNHTNEYAEYLRMENRASIEYHDICRIWPQNTDSEREVFLKFLMDAELCFIENNNPQIQLKYRTYVIPQVLIENRPKNIDIYINEFGLSEKHIENYKLIPASFVHRFIVRIKNVCEIRDLWQYGVYFSLNNNHVVVEISEVEDRLIIHHSPGANELRDFVLDEFSRIKVNIPFNLVEGEKDMVREMILRGREMSIATNQGNGDPKILNTQKMKDKTNFKIFISYAHDDREYFEVFSKEFSKHLNTSVKYSFSSFDDREILLGSDWNSRLEKEIETCQVGILLVSSAFLTSEYIQEKELADLILRLKDHHGFVLVPIYFEAFDFHDWHHLKVYQFFKPSGVKYGSADKDDFCFAHLVTFYNSNGRLIANKNSHRNDYLKDLKKEVLRAIEEKFG
ncbi:leucine-rich repeat domain-containing protein [Cyclobacterium plantarum]|uniref:leucine-rich repeat domain-containing protein n=1 Tax=Cyclobacterium plantarum TaxID=2716263 RepID=UPI003F6E85B2